MNAAAKLIKKAQRPLILVTRNHDLRQKQLMTFAEKLDCPVTTTLLGKGVFSETHDLSLGMLGMHGTAYANKAICECAFINVGSWFDDRIIGQADKFCADAKIIHMDIDAAEMNKMIYPDIQLVCDAKAGLSLLIEPSRRNKILPGIKL